MARFRDIRTLQKSEGDGRPRRDLERVLGTSLEDSLVEVHPNIGKL
jgi:hypothetical protein